jgi:hypothetical protein
MKAWPLYFALVLAICSAVFVDYVSKSFDTTKKSPTYANVDVLVEYEWGDSETIEDVNVLVKTRSKKPHSLEVLKGKHTQYDLLISESVVVKIYCRDTGEILKIFGVAKSNNG